MTTPRRPRPKTGDVRETKKHGRQVRVPVYVHDSRGNRIGLNCTGGRQNYEWVSLTPENVKAYGLGYLKLLPEVEP